MKHFFIIAVSMLFASVLRADAQDRVIYNFEGVAFNTKGKLVANSGLQLRVLIRNQKAADAIVYEENQTVYTNGKGLFTMLIGNGKSVAGNMSSMASERDGRFMKIEMSSVGETNGYGPVRFKCIKCKRCNDRYIPHRVEARG